MKKYTFLSFLSLTLLVIVLIQFQNKDHYKVDTHKKENKKNYKSTKNKTQKNPTYHKKTKITYTHRKTKTFNHHQKYSRALNTDINLILESGNYFNGSIKRKYIFETWINNHELITELKRGLHDTEWLKNNFSKQEQAKRRYFAIQTLGFMHKDKHESEHLENMIRLLSNEKIKNLEKNTDLQTDFKDLLHIYFKNINSTNLKKNDFLTEIIQKINLDNINSEKIQSFIDDEIFILTYPIIGKKKASRLLDKIFPNRKTL